MNLLIIAVLFIIGLLFCCTYSHHDLVEGFKNGGECPNLLIQKGKELHLIYTNKARIPGVNPIKFKNLEDYVEFLNWQRSKGIRCPVLYFQQTYDAQNKKGYRMLPDMVEKQGGLSTTSPMAAQEQPLYDANHDDLPYNRNSYPGFDAQDQYIGAYTPLDKNFASNQKISANAMDVNWGGSKYSEKMVLGGVYNQDMRIPSKSDLNPYKVKQPTYQQRVRTTLKNTQKARLVKHPSKVLQREIATRYGGNIENRPLERSVVAAAASEDSGGFN